MSAMAELLGSLLVCGFDGKTLPEQLKSALAQNHLSGVILFARNYEKRRQLRQLTDAVRAVAPQALIAVDQEGGRVVRFTGDFPVFPGPAHFVERDDPAGLFHAARVTAKQLRMVGVNFNLAPVCDLTPNGPQHVIAGRAASSEPEEVCEVVESQIAIMREQGLLTCAKHFPGLGSAVGDPHSLLSRSERSRQEFREIDYLPFRAACAAGVDSVMPTHLLASGLDAEQAATFSATIVQEELRGYLGFDRVVVTDDLTMGAVTAEFSPVEAAIAALRAGNDLLLYRDLEIAPEEFVGQVCREIESDDLLQVRLEESAARIAAWKNKRSSAFDPPPAEAD